MYSYFTRSLMTLLKVVRTATLQLAAERLGIISSTPLARLIGVFYTRQLVKLGRDGWWLVGMALR
jgi:hypothetical protein